MGKALTMAGYKPRLVDGELRKMLDLFGAVCVEGPKWCGKTWTSLNQSSSVYYVGDSAMNYQNRRMADLEPLTALRGQMPHLIDEWQEVPKIWDAVRFEVDKATEKGRFILTGSSTPNYKGVLHSGAGRIGKIRMHPMSLFESGDSSGIVSIRSLLDGSFKNVQSEDLTLDDVIRLTVRGGWPGNLAYGAEDALKINRGYVNSVVDDDLPRLDETQYNKDKFRAVIRSLARNESTLATNARIMSDIASEGESTVSAVTFDRYMDLLNRMFLLSPQPAFSPNYRSSLRVGSNPKRHLVDPSLSIAAMNLTPSKLKGDLETMGLMFEAMCERDLRVYAQANNAELFHYRDAENDEIDAIIEFSDGRWGAFEIKLGANQEDKAAESLTRICDKIARRTNKSPPAFKCVILGLSSFAYRREDGVYSIPITALRD